jgi:three-Cys-motif partner protein
MNPARPLKFDEIGYWSEIKLDIVKDYASAYSTILAAQKHPKLHHVYIDAFAGAGVHVSKKTGGFVPGSPVNALLVTPPFQEYYLIDIDKQKAKALKDLVANRPGVHVFEGDCNTILLNDVFPNVLYGQYRRGLCLLDPYGLHLRWSVSETAGKMGTIDMFLNFPVADINRNVLWRDPEGVAPADIERMNAFWGDASWQKIAYTTKRDLFAHAEKEENKVIAEAFRERLRNIAQFKHVPEPLPMRNSKGAIVYYLFFASHKPAAEHIISDIFSRYRQRGAR